MAGGSLHDDDENLALAHAVAEKARQAGGRALIVGGWPRDRLLGRSAKDIDLEVFRLNGDKVKSLLARFGAVQTVGESFTVYKVGTIDVALPRRESKTGRGHRAFEVRGDPDMTFEEAARRRDFTINAIGYDPLTGEWLDPFDGRGDLERRVLRAVDARTFGEDSLRVLRGLQFAARFALTIDPATAAICRDIPLDDLPSERIWGEVEKLLSARRPSIGFALALDLLVIERLFPELLALVGCEQEPEWHPEGDVWVHTLMVIDNAVHESADLDRPRRLTVMLGAMCHDLGKPSTTAFFDGRIRSHNHEEAGVPPTLAILDRLNVHTIEGFPARTQVVGLTAHHLKPGMWYKVRDQVGDGAFRRLAQKVDLELLARLARADCEGRTGEFDCAAMDWFVERARTLGVEHRPPAPLLLGRHVLALGLRPGPEVGEILRRVYERQLDGEITTLEQAIAVAKEVTDRSRKSED